MKVKDLLEYAQKEAEKYDRDRKMEEKKIADYVKKVMGKKK